MRIGYRSRGVLSSEEYLHGEFTNFVTIMYRIAKCTFFEIN